jgi:hypothetical protein
MIYYLSNKNGTKKVIAVYTSAIIIETSLFVVHRHPTGFLIFKQIDSSIDTKMFFTLILLIVVVCLVFSYLWNVKSRYDYFKRHGLSGPPSTFLFGHYLTFWVISFSACSVYNETYCQSKSSYVSC